MSPSTLDRAVPAKTGKTNLKRFLGLCAYLGTSCITLAQWSNSSTNNADYNDSSNWAGGIINDTFTGIYNWPSTSASNISTVAFGAGSTSLLVTNYDINNFAIGQPITGAGIYNPTAQLTFASGDTTITLTTLTGADLAVGQAITGTGIAAGTVITAINGNTITLSQPTTRASDTKNYSFPTTITGIDRATGTITLSNPTTAANSGSYNFGALPDWNINITANRTLSNFTFTPTSPANVRFTPNNGTVWTFNSPNPTFTIELGGTGVSRILTLGASSRTFTLDFSGNDAVFNVNPSLATYFGTSPDVFNVQATINNAKSLTKLGAGILTVDRTINAGVVDVRGGTLRLITSPGTAGTNIGTINGASSYNVTGRGSVLEINPTGDPGIDVLGTSTPIRLNAGALAASLSGAASQTQNVGNVYLQGGRNLISNGHVDGALTNTLTMKSLTRENNATINFAFSNSSTGSTLIKISGDDSNILSSLVGGGGAAGSTNISILPWATGVINGNNGTLSSNTSEVPWAGTDFVTYTSSGGFRMLAANEYFTADGTTGKLLSNAAITDNVSLTAASSTVSSSQTINALKFTGATLTINAGQTLDITSGAINTASSSVTFAGDGAISSGNNPFVITGRARTTVNTTITNTITDNNAAGLIVAALGNGLVLNGTNTYGGATIVQGNLFLGNSKALPSTSALQIDTSGVATVNSGITASTTRLSGSGLLAFAKANDANRVNVGAVDSPFTGANNTVTVGRGGTLAPGDLLKVGTLTLGANVSGLTLNDGGTFQFNIASATSASQILNSNAGTNLLTLNGGTLSLNFLDGYNPEVGTSWTLTSGFNSIDGLASNLLVVDSYGYSYTTSLVDNNLVVTVAAIPEPSSLALWAGGLALLGLGARRRLTARREKFCLEP